MNDYEEQHRVNVDFRTTVTEAFRPSSFFRHGHKSKYQRKPKAKLAQSFSQCILLQRSFTEKKKMLKMNRLSAQPLIWLYLWILLADSPGRTSCHGIVGLTLELSPTSAPSARRNLPAAITCPNTSKSIAFHEAAGQRALHTDPTQPPAMERDRDRNGRTKEREREGQNNLWYCDNLLREARMN